jgi:hypothetical protein
MSITEKQALQIANVMATRRAREEWGEYLKEINLHDDPNQGFEIVKHLESRIQSLAEVKEYLEWRGVAGTLDHKHGVALKKSRDFVGKIRKTLGYTNP